MLDFILCQCCVLELPPDEPPSVKQTVEVFLTGINFIYCSDSIIELSTAKSTDYVLKFVDNSFFVKSFLTL